MSAHDEIVRVLRAAGLDEDEIALWLGSPHPALTGFSPRHALGLFPSDDEAVAQRVLRLARERGHELERMAADPETWASAAVHIIEPIGRGRAIERCRAEL